MYEKEQRNLILDCNIWLKLITKKGEPIRKRVLEEGQTVILTSYMVVEVLRALKRLSIRLSMPLKDLENPFWDFCKHPSIMLAFEQPLSDDLINETKRTPEYRIIARVLDLEVKDVPYVVAAFSYRAKLITVDFRTIVNKRENLNKYLGVSVLSLSEFLKPL